MKEVGSIRDARLQLFMCIRCVGAIVDAIVFKNNFNLSALYGSLLSTAYMLSINLITSAHAKISINEKNTLYNTVMVAYANTPLTP
jgi:hypothetical protein